MDTQILRCDMEKNCCEPVSHIDNKGFIYCKGHGVTRKYSVPCRKIKPAELKTLQAGQPITKY